MTSFIHRNYVIYAGREGVGVLERLVHRLAADAAYSLRCKYPGLVRLELCPLPAVLVRSLGCSFFIACHLYSSCQQYPYHAQVPRKLRSTARISRRCLNDIFKAKGKRENCTPSPLSVTGYCVFPYGTLLRPVVCSIFREVIRPLAFSANTTITHLHRTKRTTLSVLLNISFYRHSCAVRRYTPDFLCNAGIGQALDESERK